MRNNHFKILRAIIRQELEILKKLTENCQEYYVEKKENIDNSINLRVLGSFLHDFYTAIEKIFREIAKDVDGELPNGSSWHSSLLERMNLEIPTIRKKVINNELKIILYDYLRFRHIFRNIYGFELNWDKMGHLIVSLEGTYEKFRVQIEKFLDFLENITTN